MHSKNFYHILFSSAILFLGISVSRGQTELNYQTGENDYYLIEIIKDKEGLFSIEYSQHHQLNSENSDREVIYKTHEQDSFLLVLMADIYNFPESKNDVLFFIHGMWGSRGSILNNTIEELHEAYIFPGESSIGRLVCIKWPGNDWHYKDNKQMAIDLSEQLSATLLKLIRTAQILNYMNQMRECKFHLMCHSLGNYFLEKIVEHVPDEEYQFPIFDQIILTAPDLDPNAMEPHQSLELLHKLGNRIHIYFNRKDLTLKYSKDLNDGQRMGLVGLSELTNVRTNLYQIDVTAVNDDRNFMARMSRHHYYRTSPTVTRDMLRALNGMDADEIPLRAKSTVERVYILVEELREE